MATFVFEKRVEFCETDAAGIAHFSSLMQYIEQAEHGLLRLHGFTVHSGLEDEVVWPRVHVEMDFAGPVRFEEIVQISVAVKHLGETSVRYGFELEGPRGAVARAETVAVCCVKVREGSGGVRLSKALIPDAIREALSKHLI